MDAQRAAELMTAGKISEVSGETEVLGFSAAEGREKMWQRLEPHPSGC